MWWGMPRLRARGGGEQSNILPLQLLHGRQLALGPGAERSRQLRVESLILIRITEPRGLTSIIFSEHTTALGREGGREGGEVKPVRTAAP